jgi:hypothetical protein
MIRDLYNLHRLHRGRDLFRSWHAEMQAAAFVFIFELMFLVAAPARAQQQPTPPQSKPPAEAPKDAPKDATPLKKAVHEKKVITEEDLTKPAVPLDLSNADEGEEINPLCDPSCEDELRAEMGFTPERELEFRNQLTFARHEIGNDKAWNSMLESGIRTAGLFCDLHRNKAAMDAFRPVPKAARDEINLHYIDRDREYAGQYRSFEGQVNERIAAIQKFAPIRAKIMQYEWSTAVNRACPDVKLP